MSQSGFPRCVLVDANFLVAWVNPKTSKDDRARLAAFECALIDRAALLSGNKKDGVDAPWQKIKIDRQIVATGKAHGATLVISDDDGVRKNAARIKIAAKSISELDLPDSARQADLDLVIRLPEKTIASVHVPPI